MNKLMNYFNKYAFILFILSFQYCLDACAMDVARGNLARFIEDKETWGDKVKKFPVIREIIKIHTSRKEQKKIIEEEKKWKKDSSFIKCYKDCVEESKSSSNELKKIKKSKAFLNESKKIKEGVGGIFYDIFTNIPQPEPPSSQNRVFLSLNVLQGVGSLVGTIWKDHRRFNGKEHDRFSLADDSPGYEE